MKQGREEDACSIKWDDEAILPKERTDVDESGLSRGRE
jgi:hypothetical protein